jgi:hypothetical protein
MMNRRVRSTRPAEKKKNADHTIDVGDLECLKKGKSIIDASEPGEVYGVEQSRRPKTKRRNLYKQALEPRKGETARADGL